MVNSPHNSTYLIKNNKDALYTSFIMVGSGIGFLVASRGGYTSVSFAAAFITAPLFSMLQKRDLDYFHYSAYSKYFLR